MRPRGAGFWLYREWASVSQRLGRADILTGAISAVEEVVEPVAGPRRPGTSDPSKPPSTHWAGLLLVGGGLRRLQDGRNQMTKILLAVLDFRDDDRRARKRPAQQGARTTASAGKADRAAATTDGRRDDDELRCERQR